MEKCLLIVCDTEGKILKKSQTTGLHDFTCFFIGTTNVNAKTLKMSKTNIFETFNILSFLSVPNQRITSVQKRVLPQLDYFLNQYQCDGYVLCGWSAYDKNMLAPIVDPLRNCYYVDLLTASRRLFKHSEPKIKTFSISGLMERYKNKEKQKHYAFTDTLATVEILKCLMKEKRTKHQHSIGSGLPNSLLKEFFQQQTTIQNVPKLKEKRSAKSKETLLSSLLPLSSSLSLEQVISLVDLTKYEILEKNGQFMKVRKGWKKEKNNNFKGKGLYILESGEFKLVRNQIKKINILQSFLAKPKRITAITLPPPSLKCNPASPLHENNEWISARRNLEYTYSC